MAPDSSPITKQQKRSALLLPLFAWVVLALCVTLGHEIVQVGPAHHVLMLARLARALSHWVDNVWVAISILMLVVPSLLAAMKGRLEQGLWQIFDATLVNFAVVDGLGKGHLIALHRPHNLEPGFPSGHATYAFLVCWLIQQRYPKLAPYWYAVAVAICWSRVAVGAHYPYQVLGGAIVGWLIAWDATQLRLGYVLPRVLVPFFPRLAAAAARNYAPEAVSTGATGGVADDVSPVGPDEAAH